MADSKEGETDPENILVGDARLFPAPDKATGELIQFEKEPFYRINDFDALAPFLISVVSDSNLWMFVSSNGALTCGRKSPQQSLFPYTTDDKIHHAGGQVGSQTIVLVDSTNGTRLWEPFSDRYHGLDRVERRLYKNTIGNKLIFEEINHSLGLKFSYRWMPSRRFGFVRQAEMSNLLDTGVRLRLIDGIKNIQPANVDLKMQDSLSTLVDAYKLSERLPETNIGIFALSSIPVDRAEPSESLLANIVYSIGLSTNAYLLSENQLQEFREGKNVESESLVRGVRGAYFVNARMELGSQLSQRWWTIGDVAQNACDISALAEQLQTNPQFANEILADVENGSRHIHSLVASADGIQQGGDPLQATRHFANTLANVMRGGVFNQNYLLDRDDFLRHLQSCNRSIPFSSTALPKKFSVIEGRKIFDEQSCPDLKRIFAEYLPLTFSRRHGDPSRPWNSFSIETQNPDGSRKLHYEGNWRDIFQNWEALGVSFPEFLEGMIFRFVNASTADGYNAYRITRDGIDWEVHDPSDPWSNIGYWGDHQIIYLLKLLEHENNYFPDRLLNLLHQELFGYSAVPYRIKSYQSILENPSSTIEFDETSHAKSLDQAAEIGSDGKLLRHPEDGHILHVNLTEKLLVPLMSKLTNLIPDGGIWMNTQRPEWNDANNALVGSGVSMVTVYYMRRYIRFLLTLIQATDQKHFRLSAEVFLLFQQLLEILRNSKDQIVGKLDDQRRRELLDAWGTAGCNFRQSLYENGLSGSKNELATQEIIEFLDLALVMIDKTIESNRRDDGLYHAYNLMQIEDGQGITILPLDEMLEGQVAVLSSGKLDASESLEVLDSLRSSRLYQVDQKSYLLYPDRALNGFMVKNSIDPESIQVSDSPILLQDNEGQLHFAPEIRNAEVLNVLLEKTDLGESDKTELLQLYEQTFNHQAFTGRSGTFFKYEGLGCIYWHMVSKLLLATAEVCIQSKANSDSPEISDRLLAHFHQIRQGIGVHKSVMEQGAFPIDPYSHTPSMAGAQQPGLTGQVKEDFLIRLLEVGVRVKNGQIEFDPFLLPTEELEKGPLRFTFCQVPIELNRNGSSKIELQFQDGTTEVSHELTLTDSDSLRIFQHRNEVTKILVNVN